MRNNFIPYSNIFNSFNPTVFRNNWSALRNAQMRQRIALTLGPGRSFLSDAGNEKIQRGAVGEAKAHAVAFVLEFAAEIIVGKGIDVRFDQTAVLLPVLLRFAHKHAGHVRVHRQPEHVNQRQRNRGDPELTALQTIEDVNAVVQALADLLEEAL